MRTRTPLPISLFALLAAISALPVFGQADAPAAAPALAAAQPAAGSTDAAVADRPAAAAAGGVAVASKGKDAAGRDTLSVDFPDEDIRNILRNVADLFELNIIMPDSLQGKTTIKLRDVSWRQIFENVLRPVGFTYIEDGNIIKIVSLESLTQEPVETQVFLINFARASDILPTISSLVDSTTGGKIVVDARSNSLVITERPSRMNRIRPVIDVLDRATDQVMIESKFVEVTDRDIKNIGVNWSSLANYGVGIGGMTGTFDRARGGSFNNGGDAQNRTGRAADTTTRTSTDITNTNGQTSGSTNAGSVTATAGVPSSTSTTGTTGGLTSATTATTGNGLTSNVTDTANNALNLLNTIAYTGATNRAAQAVFSADEFRLVLSALQTQNDVRVVSNPTIVTLNNVEASINVGEETPIPN
ncbi:MAG: secretin N-terminal domain-containing protein, partial [Opitutaceae bacterium]|nr:secretin N-terminal domain-containing protein [Opitutaceae bacterium]